MAAALTGIFTTFLLAYADNSETSTDQENKQKNVGSGDSFNNNCAENIDPPPGTSDDNCQFNNGGGLQICTQDLISCISASAPAPITSKL